MTVSSPPKPCCSSIRAGHPADDLAPLGVDVVQRRARVTSMPVALAREARDELRRVRRPAADNGDLHPFTPVSVTPSTNAFWARKKTTITGQHDEQRRRHRQVPLHLVQAAELREPDRRDPVVGVLADVEERQEEVVPGVEHREERDGGDRGLRQAQDDRRRMRNSPQPSTRAASRYSSGIVRKNWRRRKIANASPSQFGRISGQRRADQVELRPHHVERHDRHLRRQHQRDEDDEEGGVAPAPAQPRERVGDRDAREEQAERREARVDERVERPAPDRRAGEDVDVVAPPERVAARASPRAPGRSSSATSAR